VKSTDASLHHPPLPRYVPAGVALCLGVLLSVVAFFAVSRSEQDDIQGDFGRIASDRASAMRNAIGSKLLVLQSLGAFYRASSEVDREAFGAFTRPFFTSLRGVQALEWIPRVPGSEREASEEAARRDGFPAFRFTERKA